MLPAILSGFVLAGVMPWVVRAGRGASGWVIALLPLALFLYFARFIGPVAAGEVYTIRYTWVPSLGINLSFLVDGLSVLFALLITGIGALVMVYAGGYLAGHPQLGRFYVAITLFMAAMLGVVVADNLFTLFVFWELTSFSSYLLIGFDHHRPQARAAALQALLITGLGGLAMMAGFVLLGAAGGSYELSTLLTRGDVVRSSPLYLPLLLLILAGAFTKSAQVPFHIWLPGAMEAPTPVSSYLHSATMVKAGVYLLARLNPTLGGTEAWSALVIGFGAATMVTGVLLAVFQTDLKRILAYTTVSALGMLVMLLGIGTGLAVKAAVVFLLAHALYKGALFQVAGAVDHEAGTRDVTRLGGLRRIMPITAAAALLAGLSQAGLPPLIGFIGKELVYEATLAAPAWTLALTGLALLTNILQVATAGLAGLKPFWGKAVGTLKHAHEAPVSLRLGPMALAASGLLCGVLASTVGAALVEPTVEAILGQPYAVSLYLWHGVTPMLILSIITVALGALVYLGWGRLMAGQAIFDRVTALGPTSWYNRMLDGLMDLAVWQTSGLQSGYLRNYLIIMIITVVALVGGTLVLLGRALTPQWDLNIRAYELGLATLMLAGGAYVVRAEGRLRAVAGLGVVGYAIALMFMLYGAPDLAMTQFAIETLSIVLFVLVLYRLPRFQRFSSAATRRRDAAIALTGGAVMMALTLAALSQPLVSRLSLFFAENSLALGKGRNVVNVILVDFRGLDTMGEITVLAVAAIGVYALIRLRPKVQREEEKPK